MKKAIIFLAMILVGLSSCSNDDNENTTSIDPLVGVWYPFSDDGIEESKCRKKSTFTFSEDGKYQSIGIIEGSDGNCIDDFKFSGTWENLGDNKYKSTDGKTSESRTSEIIFSDNNNTMTIDTSVYKRK